MEVSAKVLIGSPATGTWLNGRRWDLWMIVGSAMIVPAVLVAVWAGAPAGAINLGVTVLVGGPHLFSTYAATYLDPSFRRTHRAGLVAISLAIPAFVIWLDLTNFQILLSVFIFAASLHVLQQNAYLADVYRLRAGRAEPRWWRWSDWALLMLAIYPTATAKLVQGDFLVNGTAVLLPPFLRAEWTVWAVWTAFGLALGAWLAKTALEARRGVLNRPKTLLIAVTSVVAFLVPVASGGRRLELAFQAVNAWHSFQYLALIWLVQALRQARGEPLARPVAWMTGRGRVRRFYGALLATTLALLAAVAGVARLDPLGLPYERYYFGFVLSFLLIHYALDAYQFAFALGRRRGRAPLPFAAPAASGAAAV